MTREDVIAALREAFDAGVSHGEDSATALRIEIPGRSTTATKCLGLRIAHYNGPDHQFKTVVRRCRRPNTRRMERYHDFKSASGTLNTNGKTMSAEAKETCPSMTCAL